MARYVVVFLLIWLLFAAGFSTWRHWTKSGAISLAKAIGLSFISAIAAITLLGVVVLLF